MVLNKAHKGDLTMRSFKTSFLAIGAVAIVVIALFTSAPPTVVQGAGSGQTVTIDSAQLPLPVKLSSTISGTIAATQSGIWNVNTKNVDERGRIPYQVVLNCDGDGMPDCINTGSVVGPNKRVVIEHVNAQVTVSTGHLLSALALGTSSGAATQVLPAHIVGGPGTSQPDRDIYYVNEQVLLYVSSGAAVNISGMSAGSGGFGFSIAATVSGYIVDLGI
jgi:hypothetical protein